MIEHTDLTNEAFFERYAKAGCVGLVGGPGLIDQLVRRSQRRQTADKKSSRYSHAFLFEGRRADGHHWIIESDLDAHRAQTRFGVQENRVSKYYDPKAYDCAAVLDFGLLPDEVDKVIGAGLELVANRTRYSIRECFALFLELKRPGKRTGKSNKLAQDKALFCSALVQQLYLAVGVDFQPDVDTKLTSPEDIAQTPIKHKRYVLNLV